MSLVVRKTLTNAETLLVERGGVAPVETRLICAAAVIANSWAGQGFVEDLKPGIQAVAPDLGAMLTGTNLDAAGSGDRYQDVKGPDHDIDNSAAV